MAAKYDFEIDLSEKEYSALMDIRGLKSDAHMMVMCAGTLANGGWRLQGSHDAFDDLLSDIWVEIEEGLAPKKNLPALRRIAKYITPEDSEEGCYEF